jgi:hypothetical protein
MFNMTVHLRMFNVTVHPRMFNVTVHPGMFNVTVHPRMFNDVFCCPNPTDGLSLTANTQQRREEKLHEETSQYNRQFFCATELRQKMSFKCRISVEKEKQRPK